VALKKLKNREGSALAWMICVSPINIPAPSGETLQVTASIGLAEADSTETVECLLQRVDEALYQSKRMGRDRVTVAGIGITLSE
jgi:PleD family two-component response regulator